MRAAATWIEIVVSALTEMDEVLIERWNERIRPTDRVYHLGDFSVCRGPKTGEILDRLHGEIHLVWGNHDRSAYAVRYKFAPATTTCR